MQELEKKYGKVGAARLRIWPQMRLRFHAVLLPYHNHSLAGSSKQVCDADVVDVKYWAWVGPREGYCAGSTQAQDHVSHHELLGLLPYERVWLTPVYLPYPIQV